MEHRSAAAHKSTPYTAPFSGPSTYKDTVKDLGIVPRQQPRQVLHVRPHVPKLTNPDAGDINKLQRLVHRIWPARCSRTQRHHESSQAVIHNEGSQEFWGHGMLRRILARHSIDRRRCLPVGVHRLGVELAKVEEADRKTSLIPSTNPVRVLCRLINRAPTGTCIRREENANYAPASEFLRNRQRPCSQRISEPCWRYGFRELLGIGCKLRECHIFGR